MKLFCGAVVMVVMGIHVSAAFVTTTPLSAQSRLSMRTSSSPSCMQLCALTERQMQFWEDVEEGLDDVAQFYVESKGEDIDRIRAFGKSARGETPAPTGYGPGHQPSEEHVEGLTAKPFWDISEDLDSFPWAAKLEAQSAIIAEEFEAKLSRDAAAAAAAAEQQQSSGMFSGDSAWQNKVMGQGWSAFRLQRLGIWNTKNCEEFPKTFKLLRDLEIPLAVRGVCFARQAPQSGVQPHTDGRNFILTSHLGLKIPQGCWIKVGEEQRTWEEEKLTTLDTSFEHSTGNPTDAERHVLIIDFWHPELTEAERKSLEFVYDLRNKFETGQVPIRKPRSLQSNEGLAGLWNTLTGGGGE